MVTPSAIGTGGGGGGSVVVPPVVPLPVVVTPWAWAKGTPNATSSAATARALRTIRVILITKQAWIIRDDAVDSCGEDPLQRFVVLDGPGQDRRFAGVAALDDRN
jgi:hypothetical protein